MRKPFFGLNFIPTEQPGFQTRFKSLDGLMGVRIRETGGESEGSHLFREQGLKEKYKSNLVPEITPSRELRKKGVL